MYAVARLDDGLIAVGSIVAINDKTGTVTLEFRNEHHIVPVDHIRRVRQTMSEIASSSGSQAEAIERIKAALLDFRKTRNGVDKQIVKPSRNRYASIDVSPAPSPQQSAPVLAPSETALPKAREARPQPTVKVAAASEAIRGRPAQRLFNDRLEVFFAPDAKVTMKLPKGQIEHVSTDKPFGKIFKRS